MSALSQWNLNPRLRLTTAPAAEPISTATAKAHLRVDHSSEDTLIDSLVSAARQVAESELNRALIQQTYTLNLDDFPAYEITLPRAPLSSVTTFSYTDSSGNSQNLSSGTDFVSYTARETEGYILPAYGTVWPGVRYQQGAGAVSIVYVAGYGSAGSSVPAAILQGMLLLIGTWYEQRESVALYPGQSAVPIPDAVSRLWGPFRLPVVAGLEVH